MTDLTAREVLLDIVASKPEWSLPEPKAAVSMDTAVAAMEAYASRSVEEARREGWQPIETAPAAGQKPERVLVVGGVACRDPEIVLADGEWWRMRAAEGSVGVPTHWRPLPDAPERDGGGNG